MKWNEFELISIFIATLRLQIIVAIVQLNCMRAVQRTHSLANLLFNSTFLRHVCACNISMLFQISRILVERGQMGSFHFIQIVRLFFSQFLFENNSGICHFWNCIELSKLNGTIVDIALNTSKSKECEMNFFFKSDKIEWLASLCIQLVPVSINNNCIPRERIICKWQNDKNNSFFFCRKRKYSTNR